MIRALDCQGFAGGFTLGMVQAGFTLVGKREMKGGFGVANCEANRHLLGHDWQSEAVDPTQWSVVDADVVFGNPPCSGFSVMSAKGFRGANSKINHCMWAFVEYAARVRPLVAIFESVQIARTSQDGHELMRALRADLERRTGDEWTLTHVRHNAIRLGGSAERRRYFWVVSRIPFGVEADEPARLPVFRDVIDDLKHQPLTWSAMPYASEATWWSAPRRTTSGQVDGHIGLDNPLTRRIQDLLAGVTWPPGWHLGAVAREYYQKHGKLPDSWAATEKKIVDHDFFMGFTSPVRWDPDRATRVITGGGLHNVVHYDMNRTITHREAARILGFPDDWLIEPLKNVPGLNMTWGKGITVDCGRWIGKWIKSSLEGAPGSVRGELIGDREYDVNFTNGVNTIRRSPGIVTRATTKSHITRGTTMSENEAASRGRPRPTGTIERDEKVLALLTEHADGLTRAEIAEKLDLQPSHAYLSIYRLSRAGTIVKAGNRWKAVNVDESPAETNGEAPAVPTPEFSNAEA